MCSFKLGRQCCDLLCKVLTIKTEIANEGKIKDLNLTFTDTIQLHPQKSGFWVWV
jgi:hypothetical protein